MPITVAAPQPLPNISVDKTPAALPNISVAKPAPTPNIKVDKTPVKTPNISVAPPAATPNIKPPSSLGNTIGAARSRPGVTDEQILAKIVEQNPEKADVIKVASSRGVTASQILDE